MRKKLKRTNLNLTDEEYAALKQEAEEMGLSMSELLRRILDEHISEKKSLKNEYH
jgi:predicted DNA binding CopG/RHH family protein